MRLIVAFCVVNSPFNCFERDLTPEDYLREAFFCPLGGQVEIIKYQKMHPDLDLKSWGCRNGKRQASLR